MELNMKTKNLLIYGIFLAAGLILGWLPGRIKNTAGHPPSLPSATETVEAQQEEGVWTCAMHPQIRQNKPGKCPLCAMDLIRLKTSGNGEGAASPLHAASDAIQLSDEALALAQVQTTPVVRSQAVREIRLYGTIQPDERQSHSLVSHTGGRIEKLYIAFTGETLRAGQVVVSIYSPELLNAQQELLEAAKTGSGPLLDAAREKLRLRKLTERQIAGIEQSGRVSPLVDIVAESGGIVTGKKVKQGDYVGPGTILFDLNSLSPVWAVFHAYESDLPFLHPGDGVEYTLPAFPGETFWGRITFIDPLLDNLTRTVKVRVEAPNPGLRLKPEMYASAIVRAKAAQWSRDGEGEILIPKTAVLWTGKRSVVYVRQPSSSDGGGTPVFRLREVTLGALAGDSYVVTSGITAGEEIVTNGVFSIDASAQLEGKRSMMNDVSARPASGDQQAVMAVDGLCDMCKERIETAARLVIGVTSASWESETGKLHLRFDPRQTTLKIIASAIAKVGHDTELIKADNAAYEALPECCKFRSIKN
jgi:Cu(I)/Ag(I) efflux system membrane fusion protein